MSVFDLETIPLAPGTLPPLDVFCTDPRAAFTYTPGELRVTTDAPAALLVQIWPANGPSGCPDPLAVVSDLETGWTSATSDPNQIRAFRQQAAEARNAYQEQFLPAKLLETRFNLSHKRLLAFLRRHPEIRTQAPRRNRRLVHGGDFVGSLPSLFEERPDLPQELANRWLELRAEDEQARYEQERARKGNPGIQYRRGG
jgi:hypothetical protein